MIARTLDDYLGTFGKLIQQNAQSAMDPLYIPGRDSPVEIDSLRKPFPRQHDAISGAVKALDECNGIFICAECGTGKTIMSQLTVHAHAAGKPYRALVFCPGQLSLKWERELKETLPGCKVHQLDDWRKVLALNPHEKPDCPTWYVISRDRAKLGARWHGAYVLKTHLTERREEWKDGKCVVHPAQKWEGVHCPKCGALQMDDDKPLAKGYFDKEKRCCTAIRQGKECGEPLWSYNRKMDRWEPAWFIKKKLKGFFRYLVADECHELKGGSETAQANAIGALISACRYTIALSGTLIGGYAEHLRPLLFRLSPKTIVSEGFTWEDSLPFSEKYGRIETRVHEKDSGGSANVMSRGSTNRSTTRSVRPGIVPTLIKHLLGNTVFLSLADVSDALPELQETLVPVSMDREMQGFYEDMERDLTSAVKQAFSRGAKKMLGPMLNGLLNWPDHPHGWPDFGWTDQDGHFNLVHKTFNFPESYKVWPKEQQLIDIVKKERAEGRQVWVYVQLTDKHDMAARLQSLLKAEGMRCEVMRSAVEPAKREAWITKYAKGADCCISHPKLVETGLDLFDRKGNHNFSSLVFYECGYNLFTLRQASRRSWRIGQHLPCRVFYMFYEDTMQERAMTLMGRKLTAAEALEGKFSSEGLAALVGEDESLELALAKSLAEQAQDVQARMAWRQPELVVSRIELSAAPTTTTNRAATLSQLFSRLKAARKAG